MIKIILYSTSHCHLCEVAHVLLMPLPDGFTLEVVDIADDELLLVQYGLRIPVLHRQDTKVELNWPFIREDIDVLLI